MHLSVIIAAGGRGTRMKTGRSKQLMGLAGKPVLAHTIAIFDSHPAVREIVVAISSDDIKRCRSEVVGKFGFARVTAIVPGGKTRSRSVRNALHKINPGAEFVLIHDGARPLFPAGLLAMGLKELDDTCDGVVFGLPLTDTIKEVDGQRIVRHTQERSRMWAAQTPQVFRREVLETAYMAPDEVLDQATDDALLVEIAGGRIKMVKGSEENIKLTTPFDLVVAEEILKRRFDK
jgi:2-C-methyl-D-erythritol 4-phosphate cytidylyltransferase